jgi:ribosomal protein L11 methyltransferase
VVRARLPDAPDLAPLLAEALTEVGGRAVVEEEGGWLVTHLPAREEDDPTTPADPARGHRPDGAEPTVGPDAMSPLAWSRRLAAAIPLAAEGIEVEVAWQDHGDWSSLWKRGLAPRRVSERLVVTPSWCTYDAGPHDLVITVDPGMAFGNAEHGTTRGCLRLLDGVVHPGDHVLDVGAGSAILSIAAALLGAERVDAVEMDALAVPTARQNVIANGVGDRVRVERARVDAGALTARGLHDGVVANIETGHLVPLLPGLLAAVAPGGWLLLSGILAEEVDEVRSRVAGLGASPIRTDADGDWRSLLFERPADRL